MITNFNYDFHSDKRHFIEQIANDSMMPNIIIYGQSGSCKNALISQLLELIYDENVHKTSNVVYNTSNKINTETKIAVKQSDYHIVIEPQNNNFDKHLIQDVIKSYAKYRPLNVFQSKTTFKTIVLNNVHKLSFFAQTALRRTLENYASTCRFILSTDSLTRILEPLYSRCVTINVARPSDFKMLDFVVTQCAQHKFYINAKEMALILKSANGNVKTMMWLLQLKKYNLSLLTIYDKHINKIVATILDKNVSKFGSIMILLYEIIVSNISPIILIKNLMNELINSKTISTRHKIKIIQAAAIYENRLQKCRKEIIHLQGFILSVFGILNEIEKTSFFNHLFA